MTIQTKLDTIPIWSKILENPSWTGGLSLLGVKNFVRGSMLSIEEIIKEITTNKRLYYESKGSFTSSNLIYYTTRNGRPYIIPGKKEDFMDIVYDNAESFLENESTYANIKGVKLNQDNTEKINSLLNKGVLKAYDLENHLETHGGDFEISQKHFLKKLGKVEQYQRDFFEEICGSGNQVIEILKEKNKGQNIIYVKTAYHNNVSRNIKEGEIIAHVPSLNFNFSAELGLIYDMGAKYCGTMIGELKSDSMYIKLKEENLKKNWDKVSLFLNVYGPNYKE